jgi:hypothetical protein
VRHLPVLLALFLAAGCGGVQRASQSPAVLTIPPGPGEWVIVEREIPLETLSTGRLVLPYGASSSGRALMPDSSRHNPRQVIRYQIVFAADPLAAGDRCALAMTGFQVVHADGSFTEVPAHGHVVDNSDRKEGFRTELSKSDRKRLVIPAGATAVAMFDRAVSVSTR